MNALPNPLQTNYIDHCKAGTLRPLYSGELHLRSMMKFVLTSFKPRMLVERFEAGGSKVGTTQNDDSPFLVTEAT